MSSGPGITGIIITLIGHASTSTGAGTAQRTRPAANAVFIGRFKTDAERAKTSNQKKLCLLNRLPSKMTRDLVVIGASAGGVSALKTLAASLPANLDASLFVVIHVAPDGPALMADILNGVGSLKAVYPRDRQAFEHGHIYLAPPDHHLLLEGDRMRVVRGPKENWHARPSTPFCGRQQFSTDPV